MDEILRIEKKINLMRKNPTYMKIKGNLNTLENRRYGPKIVSIASPDDLGKMLEIKNNSREMNELIRKYRERKGSFDDQLDKLFIEKERLQEQLFSIPT